MKKPISLVMACLLMVLMCFQATAVNVNTASEQPVDHETLLLPNVIDRESAMSKGHVARVTAKENNLNTMVFRNIDATYTQYIFDYPVKYYNANGQVKDVDLKLNESLNSFVTGEGNYSAVLSKNINDGIILSNRDITIEWLPYVTSDEGSVINANTKSDIGKLIDSKTVSYTVDDKTKLEYALTYTGIKEDIIVSEYTGQTEYSFVLKTNGLTLKEKEGEFIFESSSGSPLAFLGEVIIFTADEINNCVGSMTCDTIKENELYIVTIHVDKDYLLDNKTRYPIRIDPTIEINYSNNGSGAIQDVTINSSGGSSGTSGSLYIGKRSGSGIARTLMKFPGLDLSGISSSNSITNATVEIRDLMCESTEMTVDCNVFAGNEWSEGSASWQNVDPNSYTGPISTEYISYSNGVKQSPNHRYKFDITSAVRSWKNGFYSQSKGIIFKATSDVEESSSNLYKTFASYNRSDYRPSLSVTYLADEDIPYGWFDWIDPNVTGWVWNQSDPSRSYNVSIRVRHKPTNSVSWRYGVANQYRSDVKDAGFGTGYYGFSVPMDWYTWERGDYDISVYAVNQYGTHYELHGSPQDHTVKLYYGMSIQNTYPSSCEMYGHDLTRTDVYADNIKANIGDSIVNLFDRRGQDSHASDFKPKSVTGQTRLNIEDVDLIIYAGHGYARNRDETEGKFEYNSMHFATSDSGGVHPQGKGRIDSVNVTTSDLLSFGQGTHTKWVVAYTCNFLNTKQEDPNVMHLLDNGGRLVMGLSTKSLVVGEEGKMFADLLKSGATFKNAFFDAGEENQSFSATVSLVKEYSAKRYCVLYYGPDGGGTLDDTITLPLQNYDRSEGTKKVQKEFNKHQFNDFQEY